MFCCSCNPNKNNISKHLHCLSKGLDTYISQYDNIMLLGDLNVESSDPVLNDFCNVYNLFSLVKEPTCFKNPYNPLCIDLFLTNRSRSFQNTVPIETGISGISVSILRKIKRDYFGNLNKKGLINNRKFWKTIGPFFSEKAFHRECITLKKSNKTITNIVELAETFNTFFSKIVHNLNIDNNLGNNITNLNITDPVFCAIQKYEKHPSILKIKEMMGTNNL